MEIKAAEVTEEVGIYGSEMRLCIIATVAQCNVNSIHLFCKAGGKT